MFCGLGRKKKSRKKFFFEIKNQKTFATLARCRGSLRAKFTKVFCFFISKKKYLFLPEPCEYVRQRCHLPRKAIQHIAAVCCRPAGERPMSCHGGKGIDRPSGGGASRGAGKREGYQATGDAAESGVRHEYVLQHVALTAPGFLHGAGEVGFEVIAGKASGAA